MEGLEGLEPSTSSFVAKHSYSGELQARVKQTLGAPARLELAASALGKLRSDSTELRGHKQKLVAHAGFEPE